jgi:hypothetical protein
MNAIQLESLHSLFIGCHYSKQSDTKKDFIWSKEYSGSNGGSQPSFTPQFAADKTTWGTNAIYRHTGRKHTYERNTEF